jgi:spermidine synthase
MPVRPGLFRFVVVLSSFLLFLIQPIIAKQILPWFGGSASVWTTCLFFFQFTLLLGYVYAHAVIQWIPPGRQGALHISLIALSVLSLPVLASPVWRTAEGDPALRILTLLTTTVGLPYFVLSSTSPLVQAWYARATHAPYRLFALSNAASLAGLLVVPLAFDAHLTIRQQAYTWTALYVGFALACAVLAWTCARLAPDTTAAPTLQRRPPSPVPAGRWVEWILLSALSSLVLVSVTAFITANIAAMPLIWVLPLALYLITFILAFGHDRYQGWPVAVPAVALSLAMLIAAQNEDFIANFYVSLPLFLAGVFFICLFCHGRIAATRPDPRQLTAYFLVVSLGGALGSLSGSVLAPLLLRGDFEMPLALAAVAVMAAWVLRSAQRISRWAAIAAALLVTGAALVEIGSQIAHARLLTRNFYSSLRVEDVGSDPTTRFRRLLHGGTEHGTQFLDPQKRHQPTSYYSASSGIALAFERSRQLAEGRSLSIGVVGLGTGAIAAYGRPGYSMTFFEINPQVVKLARSEFTYLTDSAATVDVKEGDGRLLLEHEPGKFDLLAIDAFSGDAIPMHLLTKEAIALDLEHVRPDGALAIHISNQFVDLEPALARLSIEMGLTARVVSDDPPGSEDDSSPLAASDWVLLARDPKWFDDPKLADQAEPLEDPLPGPAWTDDFNSILPAIRLRGTDN